MPTRVCLLPAAATGRYAAARSTKWAEDQERLEALYGRETYERLLSFYDTVTDLFAGGNLGGLRVVARKPLGW